MTTENASSDKNKVAMYNISQEFYKTQTQFHLQTTVKHSVSA